MNAPHAVPEHGDTYQTLYLPSVSDLDSAEPRRIPLPPELLEVIDRTVIGADRAMLLHQLEGLPQALEILDGLHDSRMVGELAGRMVETTYPQRALRVLVLACCLGCNLEQQVFEDVAQTLARAKLWSLVSRLASLSKTLTSHTTARLLNWRTRSIVELSKFALLDDVLRGFDEEGLRPDRRTFHTLISGHLRNKNLPVAMEVLDQMQDAGFNIDASTQAVVAGAYRNLGPDIIMQSQALKSLSSAKGHTATFILNALMQLSIDAHDIEKLVFIVDLFDPAMLSAPPMWRPGITTVHDGNRSRPRNAQWMSSYAYSAETVASIHPDIISFTILLNHMAYMFDLRSGLHLVQQLQSTNLQPDGHFVAALVRLYFAVNLPNVALRIVVSTCKGRPEVCDHFRQLGFNEAVEDRQYPLVMVDSPTIEIFNAMMGGILTVHGLDGMMAILQIMEAHAVAPDNHSIDTFLSHLNRMDGPNPSDIARILHHLLSLTPQPSPKHAHALLRIALRYERKTSGRVPNPPLLSSREIIQTFKSLNMPASPTDGSFDPVAGIQLLSHRSVFDPIVQSLASRAIRADRAVIAMRLQHEAVTREDMPAARDVFQTMLDRGLHPNEYHYTALMQGYVKGGDFAAARSVLDAAAEAGIKSNVVMYTILIAGYARQRQPGQAMDILREMVSIGIKPDCAVVTALAGAFFAVGAYRIARTVLLQLWPFVAPFPEGLREAPLKILMERLRALQPLYAKRQRVGMLSGRKKWLLRWKLRQIREEWKLAARKAGARKGYR